MPAPWAANAETVESIAGLEDAFGRARASDRTYIISLKTDAFEGWTGEGHTWWEVGIPEVSDRAEVRAARAELDESRKQQRVGVLG